MSIIGIDLGTTNSVVCEYKKGMTHILKIDGKDSVPSVVFIDNDTVEVGNKAKRRVLIHPELTLSSMKRQLGSKYSKKIQGKTYSPVDVSYHVLSYIKMNAEKLIGSPIDAAVITVPAYFNDQQRKETREASEKAGLRVLRLIPEPTAAAIAYGLDKEKDQHILVFDLGGGTFDVSILEVNNNNFIVKAVDGNNQLGGDDFDNEIVEYLNKWIENNSNKSARKNSIAQQKLKEEAERIKMDLSYSKSTEINIPGILEGIDIDIEKFTRKEFKELLSPYLDEIVKKTNDVMINAGYTIDEINRIVMVGGSSKNPMIQELIKDHFKQPYRADNMDTYVARGAAIVCASLFSPIENETRNVPIDLNFSDVISHSLGVGMLDGQSKKRVFVPILKRNEKYPAKAAVLGMRDEKWQETVRIVVYRGEDRNPSNNTKLGELKIDISTEYRGIDSAVFFASILELDKDGILTFTAVEMPRDDNNQYDIEHLLDEFIQHQMLTHDQVHSMIQKYHFKSEKIEISKGIL